jgi:hypothetical protein
MQHMTPFRRLHRHLDPGSTMGELIFGMIMVLTFTLGARLLGADEPTDGREIMIAAIGCNVGRLASVQAAGGPKRDGRGRLDSRPGRAR